MDVVPHIIRTTINAAVRQAEIIHRFNQFVAQSGLTFKQYQMDGVLWCANREFAVRNTRNGGGIVADEMGLGKTIMMIGLIYAMFPRPDPNQPLKYQRTLIVVPPVLLKQWENEIFRLTKYLPLVYHGTAKSRIPVETLFDFPIVLTTYGTVAAKNSALALHCWDRVIYDEAHHLKNKKTVLYKATLRLKTNMRWLVTGTPLQNRLKEFHNICSLIGVDQSQAIQTDFVLRRTKKDAELLLPLCTVQTLCVKWGSEREMHIALDIHSLIPKHSGVAWRPENKLATLCRNNNRFKIIEFITVAKQACIMPSMLARFVHKVGGGFEKYIPTSDDGYTSKMDAFMTFIGNRRDNGRGKLVFCHYRSEIDTVAKRLKLGGFEGIYTYDGRSSFAALQQNLLLNSTNVLIIQIQTGCEGLNLQHRFSEIYFVSPHWNPYVEEQAIARCHRFGQNSPVNVFRFIMDGFQCEKHALTNDGEKNNSLELHITNIQSKKREIFESLFDV